MPEIEVAKPFTHTDDSGKRTPFKVGRHEVSEEIAGHWYVKSHLSGARPIHPDGSPGHMKATEQIRRRLEADGAAKQAALDDAVTAELRKRHAAEMTERVAEAMKEGARRATLGEEPRIAAEVERRVAAAAADIEARLTAAFDAKVKDAADAAVLAHMEAEEKARVDAGSSEADKAKGGKVGK